MIKQFILTIVTAIMLRHIILSIALVASYIILPLFLPWWTVAIAALFFGFMSLTARNAFLQPSATLTLVWGIWAQIHNAANGGLLANKIGALFGGISSIQLVLITAALGGLIGGLFGYLGYGVKRALLPKQMDSI